MARVTELHVNGKRHLIDADPQETLLAVLRDRLGLSGSKYGCGEGQCGACTVIVDSLAVKSCVARVGNLAGKQITTVEALERDGNLHPMQQAFLDHDAMQCGYCTPGMIMAGCALVQKNPAPTSQDIVAAMEGNICRCGTYARIVRAVEQAAAAMKGGAA